MKRLAKGILFALNETRWWLRGSTKLYTTEVHVFVCGCLGAIAAICYVFVKHSERNWVPEYPQTLVEFLTFWIAWYWGVLTFKYLRTRIPPIAVAAEAKLTEVANAPTVETPKAGRLSLSQREEE